MALIKCSGCGAEISPDAAACPKCGHPKAKQRENFWRPSGCAALVLGVFGVFMVVGLLRSCAKPGTDFVATAPGKPGPRPAPGPTLTDTEKATAQKEAGKRAAAQAQEMVAARAEYAKALRIKFLDRRQDIKVSVGGRANDQLLLRYSLFSDVWVHDFRKGLAEEVHAMGFKSVDFNDGYNYHTVLTFK